MVSCKTDLYLVNLQSWTVTNIFSYASAVGIANNAFHNDYILIQDQANSRLVSYQISTGATSAMVSDSVFSKTRLNIVLDSSCSVDQTIHFIVVRRWDSLGYISVDVSSISPCTTCPNRYNRSECYGIESGTCFPCIACGSGAYTRDCITSNVYSSVSVEPSMVTGLPYTRWASSSDYDNGIVHSTGISTNINRLSVLRMKLTSNPSAGTGAARIHCLMKQNKKVVLAEPST